MNEHNNVYSYNDERTWTLEEANQLIPIITKAFDGIFALTNATESIEKDITVLHEIWGSGIFEPDNPDYSRYKEFRQQRSQIKSKIEHAVSELHSLGCAIDDLKRGIVHFYHKTQRGVIVFCWRYGEQKINHWHELSWRANRKPVGLLQQV